MNGTDVLVTQAAPETQSQTLNYTLTSGLSSAVSLIGSNANFKFESGVGSKWKVNIYARPSVSLAAVAEAASISISTADQDYLFGTTNAEPYYTFRNLWF